MWKLIIFLRPIPNNAPHKPVSEMDANRRKVGLFFICPLPQPAYIFWTQKSLSQACNLNFFFFICLFVCVRVCVRVCVPLCVCVCVRARVRLITLVHPHPPFRQTVLCLSINTPRYTCTDIDHAFKQQAQWCAPTQTSTIQTSCL